MADSILCRLDSRSVLTVSGPEAAAFLDRMITQKTDLAREGRAAFGALLTPQGKIISDFLLIRSEDGGFLLDAPTAGAADLAKRLNMFKLRADVTIGASPLAVFAGTGEPPTVGTVAFDPRHQGLGWRLYAPADSVASPGSEGDWQARRITLGIPEAGADLPLLDAFPHDLAMDSLQGVDFDKGCYVGQEIVSRMRYRGTARRRPVAISAASDLAPAGTEILIGGRSSGHLGSSSGRCGIAVLRLDKLHDALKAGESVTVDGQTVSVALPHWADYGWPDASKSDAKSDD